MADEAADNLTPFPAPNAGIQVPITQVPGLMNEKVLEWMQTFHLALHEMYKQQERTNAFLEEIRDGLPSRPD